MIDVTLLGSGATMPTPERGLSAAVLRCSGRCILFDCGEGTQAALRREKFSPLKIDLIALSHYHGDHIFGLFGLLSTMAMYNRLQSLHIFGPEALRPIINFYLSFFADGNNYEIEFHEVKAKGLEEIFDNGKLKVSAFPLKHKIECYGYRFDEILSERHALKRESSSFAYCSDTMAFPELPEYVKGVKLLYHECTYTEEMAQKAIQYYHSTTKDAAECALKAEVGKLILGHYSSRIRDISIFEKECQEIFPNTVAADDCDVFEID